MRITGCPPRKKIACGALKTAKFLRGRRCAARIGYPGGIYHPRHLRGAVAIPGWAEQQQGVHATNLQHDGVVFRVPDGMSREDLEDALSNVCSDALGYPQPVEEKRLGDDEEQELLGPWGAAAPPLSGSNRGHKKLGHLFNETVFSSSRKGAQGQAQGKLAQGVIGTSLLGDEVAP